MTSKVARLRKLDIERTADILKSLHSHLYFQRLVFQVSLLVNAIFATFFYYKWTYIAEATIKNAEIIPLRAEGIETISNVVNIAAELEIVKISYVFCLVYNVGALILLAFNTLPRFSDLDHLVGTELSHQPSLDPQAADE